ncbi:penicillin-binding protein 2 [Candidatus Aerophobetes bacterium]|nr:penicillin-binding protein 2 [Candidatus Aerophobetes bacterium]
MKIIIGILLFIFSIILVRAAWLQIVQGERYRNLSQTSRLRLIPQPSPRGLIVDTQGSIIGDNVASFSVGIIPENIREPEQILNKLKAVLPEINVELCKEKIKKTNNPFRPVIIQEKIDLSKVTYLMEREQEFPGVVIITEPIRNYPQEKLLGNVVGYVGEISEQELKNPALLRIEAGDLVGKTGLEKAYNQYLQGEKGGRQVEVDAYGRDLKIISERAPLPGDTISLTIDLTMQKIAQEEMGERNGVVLLANPHTGKILSMVSLPSFDPNLFAQRISREEWLEISQHPTSPLENKAIRGEYPPGSTFKIITLVAGLEGKVITPDTTFTCSGSYQVGNRIFKCWKEEGHGKINLKEAFIHSCNSYFYQLGLKVGVEEMAKYARAFGLGESTRIDLASEKVGLVPTAEWKRQNYKDSWYPGDTANLSIGQGYVLATPIQMLNIINAVANGGYLVRPYLVEEIFNLKNDTVFQSSPEKISKVPVSNATLTLLREAAFGVVEKGTGWRAKNNIVKVAGKTGTAHVPGQNPHNWFIGYAPADNPALSILVLVEHREEDISIAPEIAGKIFSRIFQKKIPEKI